MTEEAVGSQDVVALEAVEGVSHQRKRRDPLRYVVKGTVRELARLAQALLPAAALHILDQGQARSVFRASACANCFLADEVGTNLYGFVLNSFGLPVSAVRLEFASGYSDRDKLLAGTLARVFNSDLAAAPDFGRHSDLWASLQQTRMIRVIARLTTFNSNIILQSLRMIEGAREMTYEGSAFAMPILLTKALKHIAGPAGKGFVLLPKPMPLGTAILGEKWTRALTMTGSVALVVHAQRQLVMGLLVLPDETGNVPAGLHVRFSAMEAMVTDGVALVTATPHGDIWMRLSNGMTFLRRRSRWQLIDLEPVKIMLGRHAGPEVAEAMMTLALDASLDRRGGLLAILDDPASVAELVADRRTKAGRANRGLRDALQGLDFLEPAHAPLLRSAAAVDGAILLASDGTVLDGACMVVDPPAERIKALPGKRLRAYAGARSTAARNCSVYGIALKISADGPISVFEEGRVRFEIG